MLPIRAITNLRCESDRLEALISYCGVLIFIFTLNSHVAHMVLSIIVNVCRTPRFFFVQVFFSGFHTATGRFSHLSST
jgi:hypothetical protein